ncbi:autotransporter assembly complex protein TamA [Roseococcus sp. YIM B11640]|uniref:autotransporter assembly complex protein TamA n=1 Tax=Roseococcus sp. YIM B11640 TaxID=3133973 RepID=UPI003C79A840
MPAASPDAPDLPYRTTVQPTGNDVLDGLLRGASGLISLQERAPTDAEGLVSRISAEPARLRPALESEGYWAGRVEVVAKSGAAIDAAALAAAPHPVELEIRAVLGPRYTYRHIQTLGGGPPVAITPGAPARAVEVIAAQEAAWTAMREDGRPLARIERAVTVDHGAQAMDITFTETPGPRADFAMPAVEGTERVNPEVVRRVAALRLAERSFTPGRLAAARGDVSALGPFSSVRIDQGTELDADGRLPVMIRVRERPFRAFSISAAYETNYGLALRGSWEHRNLFGGAENLRLELEASRLGNELDRMNARAGVTYRQPLPFGFNGSLVTSLAFVRERLDSYDRDAGIFSMLYERRLTDRWTVSAGPVGEAGQAAPSGEPLKPYQIAGVTGRFTYDSTDSRLDPRRGIRAQGSVTPSYAFSESSFYVPVKLGASTYFDLSGNGRSILALRGALGSLLNATAPDVPPSQRFYAGGGGSIRGYDYQSVGPRDARGRPAGGASLIETSVEFRQRFGSSYGAVAFVDAGGVGTSASAPTDELRVGAGVGARYYTAIGPIRADVAIPLVRQQGSGSFGFYIGIGHAF